MPDENVFKAGIVATLSIFFLVLFAAIFGPPAPDMDVPGVMVGPIHVELLDYGRDVQYHQGNNPYARAYAPLLEDLKWYTSPDRGYITLFINNTGDNDIQLTAQKIRTYAQKKGMRGELKGLLQEIGSEFFILKNVTYNYTEHNVYVDCGLEEVDQNGTLRNVTKYCRENQTKFAREWRFVPFNPAGKTLKAGKHYVIRFYADGFHPLKNYDLVPSILDRNYSEFVDLNATFDQQICFNFTNNSYMHPQELTNHYLLFNLTNYSANYTNNAFFVTIATNETGFVHLPWFGNMSKYQYINDTWGEPSGDMYLHTMGNITNGSASGGPASLCVYIKNNTAVAARPFQIWTTDLINPYANYTGWTTGPGTGSCILDGTLGHVTCPVLGNSLPVLMANTSMYNQHMTWVADWVLPSHVGPMVFFQQNTSSCGKYGTWNRRYTDDNVHPISAACNDVLGPDGTITPGNILRQRRYNSSNIDDSAHRIYINNSGTQALIDASTPFNYDPAVNTFIGLSPGGDQTAPNTTYRNLCVVSSPGEEHSTVKGVDVYCMRSNATTDITFTNVTYGNLPPEVNLSAPSFGSALSNFTVEFNFSVFDPNGDNLKNASLWADFASPGGGIVFITANTSALVVGPETNTIIWNVSEGNGTYTWNIEACDIYDKCAKNGTSLAFTLDNAPPAVNNSFPTNLAILEYFTMGFNFTVCEVDGENLENASLYVNDSESWQIVESNTSVLLDCPATNTINYTLEVPIDAVELSAYIWNVEVCDPWNHCAMNESNFSLSILNVPPDVLLISPTNASETPDTFHDFRFSYTDKEAHAAANASLWANFTGTWSLVTLNKTVVSASPTINAINHTITQGPGEYIWNVQVCDIYGKCRFNESNRTLTLVSPTRWLNTEHALRKSFTVTNPTNGDLTEYTVRVNITNTDSLSIVSLCADIVFANATHNISFALDFRTCGEEANTSAWVQIPFMRANTDTTFYMYYNHSLMTASLSDEAATFNFTSLQETYAVVSENNALAEDEVVSYLDNNLIWINDTRAGGGLPWAANLSTGEGSTIPNANLSQNSTIKVRAPASFSSLADGDNFVPFGFFSTEFVYVSNRRTPNWLWAYARFGDANVQVCEGANWATCHGNVTIINGTVTNVSYDITDGNAFRIRSTTPLAVFHEGNAGGPDDNYVLHPPDRDWYVVSSNYIHIAALNANTQVTYWASDGTSSSQILGAGGVWSFTPGGSEGTAPAFHIEANDSVSVLQMADSDGIEQTTGMPYWELSNASYYGRTGQYIAIGTTEPNTNCTLYNGTSVENESKLSGGLEWPYPNKVYFGSSADGLYVKNANVTCNSSFFSYWEYSVADDEHNIWQVPQNRQYVYPEPNYSFGPESSQLDCGNIITDNTTLSTDITNKGEAICYTITASDTTFNCDGYTIESNGNGTAFLLQADNVLLLNCSLLSWGAGINNTDSAGLLFRHGDIINTTKNIVSVYADADTTVFNSTINVSRLTWEDALGSNITIKHRLAVHVENYSGSALSASVNISDQTGQLFYDVADGSGNTDWLNFTELTANGSFIYNNSNQINATFLSPANVTANLTSPAYQQNSTDVPINRTINKTILLARGIISYTFAMGPPGTPRFRYACLVGVDENKLKEPSNQTATVGIFNLTNHANSSQLNVSMWLNRSLTNETLWVNWTGHSQLESLNTSGWAYPMITAVDAGTSVWVFGYINCTTAQTNQSNVGIRYKVVFTAG